VSDAQMSEDRPLGRGHCFLDLALNQRAHHRFNLARTWQMPT
jgi:hypothetical protein